LLWRLDMLGIKLPAQFGGDGDPVHHAFLHVIPRTI
jgi:hypothetical protein